MELLQDAILKYIAKQTIVHPNDIIDNFQKEKYDMKHITQAITDIDSEDLISTARGKTASICLTREGKKALKVGFANYLKMKEQENKLNDKIKITTLWSNYINIANAVWGAVGFILGVLAKDRLTDLWEWLSTIF